MFTCNPLLVPELLQCILDCFPSSVFDNDIRDPESQRALVALARTCRATSEPSLDRIWRVLGSLEPLIWCFTGYSKVYEEVHEGEDEDEYLESNELVEMVPPTPDEWAVISRYSHRVRELTIAHETPSFRSLRFLKCIGSRSSPLLPNLRVLLWYPREAHLRRYMALIQPLLGPSLIHLQATLSEGDGATLRSFLQKYYLQCPSLKIVVFESPGSGVVSGETTQELSRAVCTHENLEYLEVSSPLNDVALRQLSISPTLKVLSVVHFPENPQRYQGYFLPKDIPFPHVEDLKLTTSNLDFVTTLLRPHNQIFHSFRLHLHDRPTAKALSTFFSVLVTRPHTNPFYALRFKFAKDASLDAELLAMEEYREYCLSYQSFRPLTSLSSLRELVIDWKHQISLDDDELADMARSWPSLRLLKLNCRHGADPPSLPKFVTLKGLLTLAASCPDLHSICLPLDAREVPTDIETDVCHIPIQSLQFPESPITQAPPVATFLFTHFPSVTNVVAPFTRDTADAGADRSAYSHTWAQVSLSLLFLRHASKVRG